MFTYRISRIIAVALLVVVAGAVLGARAAEPDLRALVDAAKSAEDGAPDMARLSLVNATSNFLLRIDGDIDFPFQVAIDMPIDAQPQSLGVALKAPVEATGRYVVIFDVALAKVTRRVRDMKEQPSRRVVAVNKIENPAFVRAVRQLDKASAKAEKHPGNDKVIKLLDESQLKVGTTPQYLEQPVYGPYNYRLADVEGTKALTVNYYLVDRLSGRYMKSIFDVVERERFTIAYDLDPSDPGQSQLGSDVAREDDVRDWERAPVMVSLSQLLDHALAQGGPTLAAGDLGALLDGVARDRSRAVARAEAERYDQRPLNDPRFDSVVAIYTPDGMGSGFYVRSNIVMTNWHVVEKRPIVELRLYDKRETFGQVIAKDVLLDLALVKVQDRGRPVEFFLGHELLPGERVDAIGHPKRQLFTITRGVVSAIRKQAARTNAAQSSRQVFYVQTDAEINPGNSGGPLFKGDKVVGVNTFNSQQRGDPGGSVMVPNPGMGFAVHYSEAKRFLDEAMRGE